MPDTNVFTALLQQALSSPAAVLVIIGLSIVAYLLELWPNFNSKFIPIICILAGPCVYWLFASSKSVPESFPHPSAVLIVNGLIAGFISTIVHVSVIRWAITKFGGVPADKPNDNKP